MVRMLTGKGKRRPSRTGTTRKKTLLFTKTRKTRRVEGTTSGRKCGWENGKSSLRC